MKHLISNCAGKSEPCRKATCPEAVKAGPNGRFYITMGHAGFNTKANNGQGYETEKDARADMAKHLLRPDMIQAEQVLRVYSGRPGCACGCRGEYRETSRAIKLALGKLRATDWEGVQATMGMGEDGLILFWDNETGTRTYTIYFRPEAA